MKKYLESNDKIRIMGENMTFNFTILEIEGSMCLFLVKKNDVDIKHHLFIENPKIHTIFDNIFNNNLERSITFREYLEKT